MENDLILLVSAMGSKFLNKANLDHISHFYMIEYPYHLNLAANI